MELKLKLKLKVKIRVAVQVAIICRAQAHTKAIHRAVWSDKTIQNKLKHKTYIYTPPATKMPCSSLPFVMELHSDVA